MKLSSIRSVAESQRDVLNTAPLGLEREVLPSLPDIQTHALVVSGIRRCGKSTLLNQYVRRLQRGFFYFNFEDIRLSAFQTEDYQFLDIVIQETDVSVLFFDEIQQAPQWERYIRQKLDAGFQVLLTGSNAALLSRELGTALTGRHIQRELFPFSYGEFLLFHDHSAGRISLERYLEEGGFPEFLKTGNREIVQQLQDDILYRDIAVRYNIRDERSLKRLYLWLLSNAGRLMTPSKLTGVVGIKSPTTVLEYLSHLESAWMVHVVPRFAWSAKAQSLAPKKIYSADPAFVRLSSLSFSRDLGSSLENFVYLELRRRTNRLFYFAENDRECDFVVDPRRDDVPCMQVCWELTAENEKREISGLIEAMNFFSVDSGVIFTADQEDRIIVDGKTIDLVPAWKFDFSSVATGTL